MAHLVDGYGLKFTGVRTWKAERWVGDHLVDVVPVTWTKGGRRRGSSIFLEIWYQHRTEMDAALKNQPPLSSPWQRRRTTAKSHSSSVVQGYSSRCSDR